MHRAHRSRRGRPLREDGPQRHRVRGHAAHRGGVRPAAQGGGVLARADRGDLPELEHRAAGLVSDRDHRRGPRPHGRGHRKAVRRHRAGPGGAEGHRALDRADRARPGRSRLRDRGGGLRAVPLRPRRPARGLPGAAGAGGRAAGGCGGVGVRGPGRAGAVRVEGRLVHPGLPPDPGRERGVRPGASTSAPSRRSGGRAASSGRRSWTASGPPTIPGPGW